MNPLQQLIKDMRQYSDDNDTYEGAIVALCASLLNSIYATHHALAIALLKESIPTGGTTLEAFYKNACEYRTQGA